MTLCTVDSHPKWGKYHFQFRNFLKVSCDLKIWTSSLTQAWELPTVKKQTNKRTKKPYRTRRLQDLVPLESFENQV